MTTKLDDRDRTADERPLEPLDDAHRARVRAGLDNVREGRLATP